MLRDVKWVSNEHFKLCQKVREYVGKGVKKGLGKLCKQSFRHIDAYYALIYIILVQCKCCCFFGFLIYLFSKRLQLSLKFRHVRELNHHKYHV